MARGRTREEWIIFSWRNGWREERDIAMKGGQERGECGSEGKIKVSKQVIRPGRKVILNE